MISRLCWEILDENTILKSECSNLNLLRRYIRKLYRGIKLRHYEIYFRYSLTKFMKIFDQYSYKIFYNMDSTHIIYMYLLDCDSYIPGTRQFLNCLETKKMLQEEFEKRSKYDVEMKEPDIKCMEEEGELPKEKTPTIAEIINYATRHMDHEECFNTDMLLQHKMITTLKKGFDLEKDSLINFPSSDINFEKLKNQGEKKDKNKKDKERTSKI